MSAYYNEIDPYAAEWLRNLIKAGHIAPGFVDERSITDVKPEELREYTQCHFFAGVGVWSLALRRAGWPDDKPVWTGSCPCQPFSAAGQGNGFTDERHLWPHWYHLITQHRPSHIFGEQVASKDGLGWLDLVQIDLEGADYSSAAVDICAAGVGAPHIRQRLWFVAERMGDTQNTEFQKRMFTRGGLNGATGASGIPIGMANADMSGSGAPRRSVDRNGSETEQERNNLSQSKYRGYGGDICGMADANRARPLSRSEASETSRHGSALNTESGDDRHDSTTPTNSLWRDVDWLFCRDGKWRPVRPGSFPLVNGSPSRVGRLRAYGNAINVEAATQFIGAYLES